MATTADDFAARAHAAIVEALDTGIAADPAAWAFFTGSDAGRELVEIGAALRSRGRRLREVSWDCLTAALNAPEWRPYPGADNVLAEARALVLRARALWPRAARELALLLARRRG
jgi:hypothetical protein